jgi:hypothetical protein
MAEVGELHRFSPDLAGKLGHRLVRTLEEVIQNAQFVHHFQGRGMNRVSAKITEKVGVFLQDNHVHSQARQQKTQHHAGGPASHDAATRVQILGHAEQYKRTRLQTGRGESEPTGGEKGKGRDIGYALAASSCEGAKQRGSMHHHGP